jgi:hypothetical protein
MNNDAAVTVDANYKEPLKNFHNTTFFKGDSENADTE